MKIPKKIVNNFKIVNNDFLIKGLPGKIIFH